MSRLVVLYNCHTPRKAEYPVRRGSSVLSRTSLDAGSPAFAGDDSFAWNVGDKATLSAAARRAKAEACLPLFMQKEGWARRSRAFAHPAIPDTGFKASRAAAGSAGS